MKAILVLIFCLFGILSFSAEEPETSSEENAVSEESEKVEKTETAPPPVSAPSPAPAPVETPVAKQEAQAVQAEPDQNSPWAIGLQAGQTLTNKSLSGSDDSRHFSAGGLLELRLLGQWYLQAELNYLLKGWKEKGFIQNETTLKYLEVPVFLKAKYNWNNIAPSFLIGPWVAYLHEAKQVTGGIPFDTTSTTNRVEFGVAMGVGLDIALSSNLEIGASARYGWGLANLETDPFQQVVYNRVLQIMGGFKVKL